MIVYQALRDFSLSYKKGDNERSFSIHIGDYIFIEDGFWLYNFIDVFSKSNYSESFILKHIYYEKTIWGNPEEIEYEWDWIKDINIINPTIDGMNFKYSIGKLKDVTKQWERENKLNKIIK
jgi:hypothetical protein